MIALGLFLVKSPGILPGDLPGIVPGHLPGKNFSKSLLVINIQPPSLPLSPVPLRDVVIVYQHSEPNMDGRTLKLCQMANVKCERKKPLYSSVVAVIATGDHQIFRNGSD
jgi:hypothetical protein